MVSPATLNHELDIVERAIAEAGGGGGNWPPEVARALLGIKLASSDVARMNELAARAGDGTLSSDEELEVESYRAAARLLEILKLRARVSLKRGGLPETTSP